MNDTDAAADLDLELAVEVELQAVVVRLWLERLQEAPPIDEDTEAVLRARLEA